jgi:hypothetical protein
MLPFTDEEPHEALTGSPDTNSSKLNPFNPGQRSALGKLATSKWVKL